MSHLVRPRVYALLALLAGLAASAATRADALFAVQVLRQGGCGGIVPLARPLRHNALLDRAAEQWAAGTGLSAAAARSGYPAGSATGVHVSGPESAMLELLRRSECRTVTSQGLREIGAYRRDQDTWLVLAADSVLPADVRAAGSAQPPAPAPGPSRPATPYHPPVPTPARSAGNPPAPILAGRALELVNQVRAHGARCGQRDFAPAPPLTLSGTLGGVAFGHADDMARHNYFQHVDLTGQSPADRVRAVGYREKLVGENIAYGPDSVEEAVRGWLDSPGHCENIMDPRFAEMGIASAVGRSASRRGLYWVQVLAAPRA